MSFLYILLASSLPDVQRLKLMHFKAILNYVIGTRAQEHFADKISWVLDFRVLSLNVGVCLWILRLF